MLFKQKELPLAIDSLLPFEFDYPDLDETTQSIALLSDDLDRLKTIRKNDEFIPRDQVEWILAVNHAALGEKCQAISIESHSHYLDDAIVSLEGLVTGAIGAVWRFIIKMIDKGIDFLKKIKNWLVGEESRAASDKKVLETLGPVKVSVKFSKQLKMLLETPPEIEKEEKIVDAKVKRAVLDGKTLLNNNPSTEDSSKTEAWNHPILKVRIDKSDPRIIQLSESDTSKITDYREKTDKRIKKLTEFEKDLENLRKEVQKIQNSKVQRGNPERAAMLITDAISSVRREVQYRGPITKKCEEFVQVLKSADPNKETE